MRSGVTAEGDEDDDDMMLVEDVDINELHDRNALGFGRMASDEDDGIYVKP